MSARRMFFRYGIAAVSALLLVGAAINSIRLSHHHALENEALQALETVHAGLMATAEVTGFEMDVLSHALPPASDMEVFVRPVQNVDEGRGRFPRLLWDGEQTRVTAVRPLSEGLLLSVSPVVTKDVRGYWTGGAVAGIALILFWLMTGWIRNFQTRQEVLIRSRRVALELLPDQEINLSPRARYAQWQRIDDAIVALPSAHRASLEKQMERIDAGRHSRERKAHVFASMSHDLKGPLNSILGFTELLLKGIDGPLSGPQQQTVQRIAEEAERLLVRIGDILDTARFDAGKFELDQMWVPSVEILTDCEAGARRLIGTRPIAFVSRLEPGLPPVRVDRERISRAILGLIALAIDSLEAGEIRLHAYRKRGLHKAADRLAVDLIDSGCRMEEFERLRLESIFAATEGLGEKKEVGSAGLGLVLSRRVVMLHGGDVCAHSDESGGGRGCIFSVTLPLEESNAKP